MDDTIERRLAPKWSGTPFVPVNKSGIDQFSRLPGELLDRIFELAASESKITARPISKALLFSQERAVYRTINLKKPQKLSKLVQTLEAQPYKGQYAIILVLGVEDYSLKGPLDHRSLLRRLPNLVEIDFNSHSYTTISQFKAQPDLLQLLPSLRICRIPGYHLNSSTVDWLSRIPTLRTVETAPILHANKEEEKDVREWKPARQVQQIVIRYGGGHGSATPSRFRQFFPSASISSVDVLLDYDGNILPLFNILDSGLVSLQLGSPKHDYPSHRIDHCLPRLTNLRHLHLDPRFVSPSLQTHLLSLSNLTSLSLAYYDQTPNLDLLFSNLDSHLPCLRTLTLMYLNITHGREFDITEAQEEARDRDNPYMHGNLSLLKNITNLSQMWGFWSLLWPSAISDVLPQLISMEKKARQLGLVVKSNLDELVSVFKSQVLEAYNRAVGELCFRGSKRPMEYALSLIEAHKLEEIERLFEIDLEKSIDEYAFKWEKVKLDG
ncbi:uncharacterized protein JCM6883_006565 [Sporobolomyces salmoneus]|uniref:uncharacterized protein n=1 Tax=Sporobolomyces salmoneus TaxID=183962 RepID=UPI00316C32C9